MFDNAPERVRTFELENGNVLYAKQTDPYGFWHLNLDKGQLPEAFRGAYSTIDHVYKDVEKYQTLRKQSVTEIKEGKK